MTTPADEIRTAIRKLRSGMLITRADLDMPLALLLEAVASSALESAHEECSCWCTTETCDLAAALDVARALNAGGQP